MLHQLHNHLLTNNLSDNLQSAYRAHYSTETALLDVTGVEREGSECVCVCDNVCVCVCVRVHARVGEWGGGERIRNINGLLIVVMLHV